MEDHETQTPRNRIIPVTRWNDFHPWPTVGGLRHLIFYADSNGFDRVIVRIKRRVLIDEAAFFAWADEHRASKSRKRGRKAG